MAHSGGRGVVATGGFGVRFSFPAGSVVAVGSSLRAGQWQGVDGTSPHRPPKGASREPGRTKPALASTQQALSVSTGICPAAANSSAPAASSDTTAAAPRLAGCATESLPPGDSYTPAPMRNSRDRVFWWLVTATSALGGFMVVWKPAATGRI